MLHVTTTEKHVFVNGRQKYCILQRTMECCRESQVILGTAIRTQDQVSIISIGHDSVQNESQTFFNLKNTYESIIHDY